MAYLSYFSALTDVLKAVALGGGYVSLFLVTLFEGVPLFGALIPGHVAVIAAGFLVSVGVLDPLLVVPLAIAGAVLGDYASFFLGSRFGWPLVDRLRKLFFIKDSHLDRAKRLLEANTGKALIAGRFSPVTRGLMPFLVGANRAPSGSFWLYNTLGAIVWVVSSVAVGYFIGLGYHAGADILGRLVVVAILAGLLIVWGYRFVNVRFHVFKRYELFVLGLNLLSLYGLARMIEDALAAKSFMAGFDVQVSSFMVNLASGPHGQALLRAAEWIPALGGTAAITIYAVAAGLILALRKRWRRAAIVLLSLGSAAFSVAWMKEFFMRVRPENLLADAPAPASHLLGLFFDKLSIAADPSFPSAHAVFAAAFFVVTAYLLAPRIRSWVKRESLIVLCVVLTALVGLSRLALNVHWASDVIAGWSLGVFCATASILLVRYVGALVYEKVGN